MVNHLLLVIYALLALFPVLYMAIIPCSRRSVMDAAGGLMPGPMTDDLSNYARWCR